MSFFFFLLPLHPPPPTRPPQAAALTGPLQGLTVCCLSVRKACSCVAAACQPCSAPASAGLWISALLTQGWHCTSDATQTSSEPSREGKAGAVVGRRGGWGTQNLPKALSTRLDYKVVCTQQPTMPLYAQSHPSLLHTEIKTAPADQLQLI